MTPARSHPYPAYKDSGIEWLGKIPDHWETKRIKHLLISRKGAIKTGPFGSQLHSSEMMDSEIKVFNQRTVLDRDIYGGRNYISPVKFNQLRAFEVFPGDMLVTTRGTIGRCMIVPIDAPRGILHPCLLRIQIENRVAYDHYIEYLIQDSGLILTQLEYMSNATTIEVIYSDSLKEVLLPLPPLPEQRAIVDFLDRETARIDALVAKKDRLIELLQEKRAALISHAVTKGLNPNAPMKESGVEWLGEIPAHWDVKRLKYLATVNDEALPETTDPGMEIAYVDIGNVDSIQGITDIEVMVFEDAPSRARRVVRQGDVIVSTVRTYLRAVAQIENTYGDLIVSTGFAVIRPHQMDYGYVAYGATAPYFVESVVAHSVGVSYPAINASELACLDIVFPPIEEQRAIAAFLDRETKKIDALVGRVRQAIDRLKELRMALISTAVTGKIDVRDAV